MTRISRSRRRLLASALLPLALAACTVGHDYVRPDLPVPERFEEDGMVWTRTGPEPTEWYGEAWWQAWHDPDLNELQERAQQANLSIAAAEAAWRQAQAAIGEARAAGRPQVGMGVSQSRSENTAAAQGLGELGEGQVRQHATAQATASWELDLWGAVRRRAEAQSAQAEASAQDLRAQRLSIAATVASTYLSLRQTEVQVALLENQVDANGRLLEMTERANELGTASPNDVVETRNALDSSIMGLEAATAARARSLHALAALTGQAPSSFVLAPRPEYGFEAPAPPAVMPVELLRRRPDVMAAEARVKAANAQVGAAQAAYFPSLGLSANDGYVGGSVDDLLDAPLRTWSLGAQLLGTVFDGGARRSQTAQTRAGYEATIAQYRQSVLGALQETEDALSDYGYQERQAAYAARATFDRQEVWQRKQREQVLGTASERDVLVETLSMLDAQQTALSAQGALAQDAVALFKAVGGGWQE
ncbi:efflux transporter outer membrane subunit [Pseudomonas aeruginosa]|uniref:efflux transporter outer membrane subunit n=1 Tax=Stenotrophomonas maltophilia TaxID=40324 RepID=UPI0010942537|nr:efflux transporter outer membrane subunit [Stenotrophomonas maltophilia]MCO3705742.1 efflux transporter outer membrane subunit [Pseudomonas aeruginosa]HCL2751017.1 efflux transporter outer membrane subunit [Pseudomonas aeruginosa 449A]TGW21401.1 efflux transporter outer membrane subunit [Stenotrophomonas maltophilia]HBO2804485.1 efflux transporter outer membrane subunit [Pseudomonas aeruginosa]HCL2763638.1 efflux transporter outer membrane subunit [Pseudomonas aeruginosa 449A]